MPLKDWTQDPKIDISENTHNDLKGYVIASIIQNENLKIRRILCYKRHGTILQVLKSYVVINPFVLKLIIALAWNLWLFWYHDTSELFFGLVKIESYTRNKSTGYNKYALAV